MRLHNYWHSSREGRKMVAWTKNFTFLPKQLQKVHLNVTIYSSHVNKHANVLAFIRAFVTFVNFKTPNSKWVITTLISTIRLPHNVTLESYQLLLTDLQEKFCFSPIKLKTKLFDHPHHKFFLGKAKGTTVKYNVYFAASCPEARVD